MKVSLCVCISVCVCVCVQVEQRLMRRMAIAIKAWQDCLLGVNAELSVDTMDTTSAPQPAHKLGGTPDLQVRMEHGIIIHLCTLCTVRQMTLGCVLIFPLLVPHSSPLIPHSSLLTPLPSSLTPHSSPLTSPLTDHLSPSPTVHTARAPHH